MKSLGLYIHVPFCKRKCRYCDFYSLPCHENTQISDYVSLICAHIEKEATLYRECEIDSIFIGGGTPSLLSEKELYMLTNTLKKHFKITQGAEFSIEANPESVTRQKLAAMKDCGINRLSMGLQSCVDDELRLLGRIHTLSRFEEAFSDARDVGFDNVNIDIMYALPEQGFKNFSKTLDRVVHFSPEHVSAYCLKIEEGTPLFKDADRLSFPSEDEQYETYMGLCERLSSCGYEQYELSNFAKKGHRCVHNLKYWKQEEYIGFGPSAHSFYNGVRYFYKDSLEEYRSSLNEDRLPEKIAESSHIPDQNELIDEFVMLRMRLCDGVDTAEFMTRFGRSFEDVYGIEKYVKSGHAIKRDGRYFFSPKGFFVSNYILSDILKNI